MNFIRSTRPRPTSPGGTITNPRGHSPTHSRPLPRFGLGGSTLGGRGPPGGVTGHAPRARLGRAEAVVIELGVPEPPAGGAVERPSEQPAVPSTRHAISNALRTLRSLSK